MRCATRLRHVMDELVVDASAVVDLLLGGELGEAVGRRFAEHALHAPAHADAEILSAVGRLQRAGAVAVHEVETMLAKLVAAPIERHSVGGLLLGAWSRRHQLRLADALYVELSVSRDLPLITTDRRLAPAPGVEVIGV